MTSMRVLAAILIASALVGCRSGEPRDWPKVRDRLKKQRKEWRKAVAKEYGDLRVVVTPDAAEILEGEPVWITVDVYADSERSFPIKFSEIILEGLKLSNGLKEFEKWPVFFGTCGSGILDESERWQSKSFRFQLNEHYAIDARGSDDQYVRFRPGKYDGFFDFATPSNRFAFYILPAPDSLQVIWNRFKTLAAINQTYGQCKTVVAPMDTVRSVAELLLELPAHHSWRVTGLVKCLQAPGYVVPGLTMQDSLLYARIITVLAREEQSTAEDVSHWIRSKLLTNIDKEQQIDLLEPLALQVATPEAAGAARALADDMRKQQERNRSIHRRAGS